jgi:hypothetical protein
MPPLLAPRAGATRTTRGRPRGNKHNVPFSVPATFGRRRRKMHRLLEAVVRLSNDKAFSKFQNDISRAAYEALAKAWTVGEDEIHTVERLVNLLHGKTYKRVGLSARMIHGPTSFVEFDFRDETKTCELGDMVVVSLVTSGRTRLLQRVCIIQNKKIHAKRFEVDQPQLFLLKDFPPFRGIQGIVKGMSCAYRNRSGCLGAYGLLTNPGEMLFASAPLLAELLRSRASMQLTDVAAPALVAPSCRHTGFSGLPFTILPSGPDWYYAMREMAHRYGAPLWGPLGDGFPFLGNVIYARDMFDFVRGWSQINIGEVTHCGDTTVEPDVDGFANRLIRRAGLAGDFDTPDDERHDRDDFSGGVGLLLLRIDVEHEG